MSHERNIIEIEKMFIEDMTGRGEYFLTLVDKNGDKYQGETDAMGVQTDVVFYKLQED